MLNSVLYITAAIVVLCSLIFWMIGDIFKLKGRDGFYKKPEIGLISLYTFLIFLYISPFNYFKGFQELFLAGALYIITPVLAIIIIIRVIKKCFKEAILISICTAILVFLNFQAYEMRKIILGKTIDWLYCPTDDLKEDEILEGLIFMGEEMGFENTSHCLITVCKEEYYYCSDQ